MNSYPVKHGMTRALVTGLMMVVLGVASLYAQCCAYTYTDVQNYLAANPSYSRCVNSFTLTDGGWSYTQYLITDKGGTHSPGMADFKYGSGPDQFWQNWFWYRVTPDFPCTGSPHSNRENGVGNVVPGYGIPSSLLCNPNYSSTQVAFSQPNSNTAYLEYWEPPIGTKWGPLKIQLNYTLTEISANEAHLQICWRVTNTCDQTRDIDWFAYFDPNLSGSVREDVPGTGCSFGASVDHIFATQGSYRVDVFAMPPTSRWEIRGHSCLVNRLTGAGVNNLANGIFGPYPCSDDPGSPFNPSQHDFVGAFQWTRTLAPGQSFAGCVFIILRRP